MSGLLVPSVALSDALVANLRRQNPWWQGAPQPPLPSFERWPFAKLLRRLDDPLAPILVIRGPRQIGKTTLQQQLIESLLKRGVAPTRILRVQFDLLPSLGRRGRTAELILRIADWFQEVVLKRHLNDAARDNEPAFFFLDEVQNLLTWDVQLKSLVDHARVRVLVTGSSALRIELGRDSLAGRIQTLNVGPLRLTEIAGLRGLGDLAPAQSENGWTDWLDREFWLGVRALGERQAAARDRAFAEFSERGGYPFPQSRVEVPWPEIADHLVETVVRRAIEKDLRVGEQGRHRDKNLLEEVFRLACRYVGQSPSPARLATEAQRSLASGVSPGRVRTYLRFLDSSLLLRTIDPLELRLKRRAGHPKICLCDHAIRAAWLQEIVPLDPTRLDAAPELAPIAGRIAESVTGYYFASLTGLDVAHQPERGADPEVDFVLNVGDRRIPVEVKYQRRIDEIGDTLGIRAFLEKAANRAPFGLLVTRDDGVTIADPRIIALPLKTLLCVR